MDNLPTPEQRRELHRKWLESFGFSDEDWRRIHLLADGVTETYSPPALDDLSVPIRVAAMNANPRYTDGKLGVIARADGRKVALRYWRMDENERRGWARRRGEGQR